MGDGAGLDNAVNDIQGDNPFAEMNENINEKQKKRTGPRTFTDVDLCQNPLGLNALYTTMILDKDKLKLRGKGHELQDFSKLIQTYRTWHM